MRTFAFELRQAFRALVRSPGYALTAIAMLGAGLGLSMYMFGAIDTFMLRPLPFANADRIAHVELADLATGEDSIEVPLPEYLAMARSQRSFDAFGVHRLDRRAISFRHARIERSRPARWARELRCTQLPYRQQLTNLRRRHHPAPLIQPIIRPLNEIRVHGQRHPNSSRSSRSPQFWHAPPPSKVG